MKGAEATNSGLKFEGDWEETCDFSEELEEVMEEFIESKEEIDEFEDWRPHLEDSDDDMKEKTAEEAVVGKRNIEEDFEGARLEIDRAEEKMFDSVKDVKEGVNPSKDLKAALLEIEKVLGVESIRSVRKIEKTIYKKLMLKLNPYYFDTEDFSVNLEIRKNGIYCLSINVTDERLRKHFRDRFE
ncbi:MAG: DUF5828 family protein [Candidatus Natronoplasma sp.]